MAMPALIYLIMWPIRNDANLSSAMDRCQVTRGCAGLCLLNQEGIPEARIGIGEAIFSDTTSTHCQERRLGLDPSG